MQVVKCLPLAAFIFIQQRTNCASQEFNLISSIVFPSPTSNIAAITLVIINLMDIGDHEGPPVTMTMVTATIMGRLSLSDHKMCVLLILMTDNLSPHDRIIACNY